MLKASCEVCNEGYVVKETPIFLDNRFICCLVCYQKIQRKKPKYRAVKCEGDGIKFPSLLERSCYQVLEDLRKNGKIDFFLRQIPFDLPGGSIHRVDYAVFAKEQVYFIEAKGKDLAMGKLKRKQVMDIFKIDILVVKQSSEILKIVY
jgi:hypothetical protein